MSQNEIGGCLFPLFWISIVIFCGIFVYRDATAKGKSQGEALGWALGSTFFCFPLIFILYLVLKSTSPALKVYKTAVSSGSAYPPAGPPPAQQPSGSPGGFLTAPLNSAATPAQQTQSSMSPPRKSPVISPEASGLFSAVKSSNIEALKKFLQQGTDLNGVDKDGTTVLHWAVNTGLREITELLVNGGADLSAEDNDGRTPLHWASFADFRDIAEFLLKKNAEVNARDYDGRSPIHNATEQGFKEMVELLISKGADVNMKDNEGKSPLQIATSSQYKEVADLLQAHGAWS
ncbi:MAG: ankyrin repeat domain-containing protein [Vulcanimicrobiota bacterium]